MWAPNVSNCNTEKGPLSLNCLIYVLGWGQSWLFWKPAASGFLYKKTAVSGFPAVFIDDSVNIPMANTGSCKRKVPCLNLLPSSLRQPTHSQSALTERPSPNLAPCLLLNPVRHYWIMGWTSSIRSMSHLLKMCHEIWDISPIYGMVMSLQVSITIIG